MRAFGNQSRGPSWLTAVAIFLTLIVLLRWFQTGGSSGRLEDHFAAAPPAASQGYVELPPLPSSVAGLARAAVARLGAGHEVPALTPVAQSSRLRVDIRGIQTVSGGLRLTGSATNIGPDPLPVSLSTFRFSDASGTVYAAEGDSQTTLQPGQAAPLSLELPIADPSQLTLEVAVPGDQPLRMILLQQH